MSDPWQVFPVNQQIRDQVRKKLAQKPKIFPHHSDPLLASLCTCLGLQFEMGQKNLDRLSLPLGLNFEKYPVNPWQSEVISYQGEIGLRLWISDIEEFRPTHPDFAQILHPLSLDDKGRLAQIVIFPMQVVGNFQKKGLELVIVRDWLLSSAMAEKNSVNYLLTNDWEIQNNTALQQVELMVHGQIAFSGAHDIADHLLGGDGDGFRKKYGLFLELQEVFQRTFHQTSPKKIELMTAYLLGVLLDDLAQPQWYGSDQHEILVRKSLEFLAEIKGCTFDIKTLQLSEAFHRMIYFLRERRGDFPVIVDRLFQDFRNELHQNWCIKSS